MGISTIGGISGLQRRRQVFTTSGTFTLPSLYGPNNPLYADVTIVGGGGGGGNSNHMPGGGGAGRVWKDTIGIVGNLPVIVGAGGAFGGGRGGDSIVGYTPLPREANLLPNPFFTDGFNFQVTGWSVTDPIGGMNYATNAWEDTVRQRHVTIPDAQNPIGQYRSTHGFHFNNPSVAARRRIETTNFIDVTAGTTYYWGLYTQSNSTNCQWFMNVDWYNSSNVLVDTTQFTYTTTGRNKYKTSAVAPLSSVGGLGVTKCKIRIEANWVSANLLGSLWGAYFSESTDYAPYEHQDSLAYWTGAKWSSRMTLLVDTGFAPGYKPIIAGGGGGGGANDANEGNTSYYRWGGIGGGQGGFSRSIGTATNDHFYLGGDGGGAGTAPIRWMERVTNSTTPFNDRHIGLVQDVHQWPRFPGPRTREHYLGGRQSSQPIAQNVAAADNVSSHKIFIEGGRGKLNYGHGGPGAGYYLPATNSTFVQRFDYNRELPYGNGGAGDFENGDIRTTSYGYINHYRYGNWPRTGDPGIVIFEWIE
jgi:hypothetical protein